MRNFAAGRKLDGPRPGRLASKESKRTGLLQGRLGRCTVTVAVAQLPFEKGELVLCVSSGRGRVVPVNGSTGTQAGRRLR